jgi:hypothetical protein
MIAWDRMVDGLDYQCVQIDKNTNLEFHKLFILRCYLTSNKVKSQKLELK